VRQLGNRAKHSLGRAAILLLMTGGPVSGASWSEVNAGLPSGTVGVLGLSIAPGTPSTIYVRGYGGSLFKSVDAGKNWTAISSVTGITALVVDPEKAATVYVSIGHGIVKSTDSGASWRAINSGLPSGVFVAALAIDPTSPSTLYSGTDSGIFKTPDGGQRWYLLSGNFPSGAYPQSLLIDPATTSTMYANTTDNAILKSTDSGASWKSIHSSGRLLAIDPATPGTIYAGTSFEGLCKSTDGGASWRAINSGLPSGVFVAALAIDPVTPSTIYAGGYTLGSNTDGGVAKSADGGNNWDVATLGLPSNSSILAVAIDPAAPSTVYAGALKSGMFRSIDGATSWTAASTGLTSFDLRALAIDPIHPGTLYTGAGGGVFKSADSGARWRNLVTFPLHFPYSGRGTPFDTVTVALAVNFLNPNVVYAGVLGLGGCGGDRNIFKSTDGGATWAGLVPLSGCSFGGLMLMDPTDPNTLYACESGFAVYPSLDKTTDGGASWSFTSFDADITALAIDPANPTTLYAATRDDGLGGSNGVFKSTDGGQTWEVTGLAQVDVGMLAIDPLSPSTLYAGTAAGVFKSTDGGANWSDVNHGLTDLIGSLSRITTVVIDRTDTDILYLGSSGGGVFRSGDGGASWIPFNDGLGNLDVRVLAIASNAPRTIFAATAGGVFTVVDDQP